MTTYAFRGSRAAVFGNPLFSSFVSFPGACFILALLNDIAYWRTGELQWQTFAEWLLLAGVVVGGFALLAEIIGLFFRRTHGPGVLHALGTAVTLVLGTLNSFVHARDGWNGVVVEGLLLSVATVVVMIITGWLGSASIRRRATGATRNV